MTSVDISVTVRSGGRTRFYFITALVMLTTAVVCFIPTFFAPMTRGHFVPSAAVGIHATMAFSWLVLFTVQTWLASEGRIGAHRATGLFGISLATLMVVFGVLAAINMVARSEAAGGLDAGLQFMIVPLGVISCFATFVVLAIANIQNPEWHKRFMLMATAVILEAPLARPFIYFLGFKGHMPVPAGLPEPPTPVTLFPPYIILTDLFILAPMIIDWRKRGRPHPAYLIGLAVVLAYDILRVPISVTPAWHHFASWLYSLGR